MHLTKSLMICVRPSDSRYLPLADSKPFIDDPELFASQPVCLQVVGFPYKDEELIAVTKVMDQVVNPSQ